MDFKCKPFNIPYCPFCYVQVNNIFYIKELYQNVTQRWTSTTSYTYLITGFVEKHRRRKTAPFVPNSKFLFIVQVL